MENEQDKIIGANIRRIRESKGFTQADVSKSTKITQKGLSEIENGKSQARSANLKAIAKALKCEVSEFHKQISAHEIEPPLVVKEPTPIYGEPPTKAMMNILQRLDLNQKESDLISIFKLLNDKGQNIVLSLAKTTLSTHARSFKSAK